MLAAPQLCLQAFAAKLCTWHSSGRQDWDTLQLPPGNTPHAQVAGRLVPMTITLWNKIQAKMLPTPAKFHYLFNMRELSKVFQGIILATRDRCGPHTAVMLQL